jgi:hypothetical protein
VKAASREVVTACVDVGSVKRDNLGWAVLEGAELTHGRDLVELVDTVVDAIQRGCQLALGFECPLYVPRRQDPIALTRRRLGEVGVNWCGGPGGAVLATGLVQVAWLLERLAQRVPQLRGTTRWAEFEQGAAMVWIWEAFVTSKVGPRIAVSQYRSLKGRPHEKDAAAAALLAQKKLGEPGRPESYLGEEPVSSLIGMHLLASGLATDIKLLWEPCVVIAARKP